MFTLTKNPTFRHTVKVKVPVDGGFEDQSFEATYRVLTTDEFAKFDLGTAKGSTGFLRAAIVELGDLVGADGKPLPYSDDVRDQVLAVAFVRQALARTYFEAVGGAALGN
jgi:hypothetical protein